MYYKSLIDIHIFVLGNVPLLAIVFQFQWWFGTWNMAKEPRFQASAFAAVSWILSRCCWVYGDDGYRIEAWLYFITTHHATCGTIVRCFIFVEPKSLVWPFLERHLVGFANPKFFSIVPRPANPRDRTPEDGFGGICNNAAGCVSTLPGFPCCFEEMGARGFQEPQSLDHLTVWNYWFFSEGMALFLVHSTRLGSKQL